VDLLLQCHERIRAFIGLAARLALSEEADDKEIRDAASRVIRYFSEALPLHVADEEQSIVPRLSGREPAIDAALERMRQEHKDHEPQLQSLLKTCRVLEESPGRLNEVRPGFQATVSALEREFVKHLEEEETVILPAIRTILRDDDRDAILRELRARR
jgi:iron-sulfur cluster repair protein YtfE (RIC family)